MKDFLKKYQNEKKISGLSIIVTSLVLAIGINIFLIDGTQIGTKLKTSVLDSNQSEIRSDLYVERVENKIIIRNSKDILDTKNISLSITYNPSLVEIKEFNSDLGESMFLGEKNTGFDTYLINTSGANISANAKILEIKVSKNKEESTQLNMINANFTDKTEEKYNLSTSGITF